VSAPPNQTHIRAALEELVIEFAYRVDHGPTDTVADLFVADGWYGWGPAKRSIGRESIRAAYQARAAAGIRTARHLTTNLRLREIDTTHWSGHSIWTIFAENGPPPHPASVLLVCDVNDVFVLQDGRWLFESRQLTDIFTDPARTAVLPLAARENATS
jgi:hypothetical protein